MCINSSYIIDNLNEKRQRKSKLEKILVKIDNKIIEKYNEKINKRLYERIVNEYLKSGWVVKKFDNRFSLILKAK